LIEENKKQKRALEKLKNKDDGDSIYKLKKPIKSDSNLIDDFDDEEEDDSFRIRSTKKEGFGSMLLKNHNQGNQ
jgi:hypothetical protein